MSQASSSLDRIPGMDQLRKLPRIALMGAAAAVVALVVAIALWSRAPDYSVLFSNLDDRDGGAIVSALSQMNVPYQFSESGGAILIPKDRVHEVRMQLASQGLPRGGNVGFELLEQSRFGASQFTEQVTYQRALQGELANTIMAVHSVEDARVHLAIPRETLFVRDRQEPTASVMLTLFPGRSLTEGQVSAIQWLVSSSVPSLHAENVSVVDQNGRLLTPPTGQAGTTTTQRDFVTDVEQRAVQRIMTLLNPLLGPGNVRAQVSADVDFSAREQTSESYRPNQKPGEAAIRSEQSSVSLNNSALEPEGVPGALTNQPPINSIAPLVDEAATAAAVQTEAQNTAAQASTDASDFSNVDSRLSQLEAQAKLISPSGSARTDVTTNYEVDRTISHVKNAVGEVKRLSVAVVLNHRFVDKEYVPLSDEEIDNIRSLVMQAVGYSAERGDSISVVNSRFSEQQDHSVPFWKNNTYIEAAMTLLKYLVIALLFFAFWRIVINPIIQGLIQARLQAQTMRLEAEESIERQKEAKERAAEINRYEDNVTTARVMAEKDPRAVAMVLRAWMNKEDKDDN